VAVLFGDRSSAKRGRQTVEVPGSDMAAVMRGRTLSAIAVHRSRSSTTPRTRAWRRWTRLISGVTTRGRNPNNAA